jgi:3-phenylpropionate/trans-cinnamate dioxygenase ferredoxin reductase subunit
VADRLEDLSAAGVSIWLDDLSRKLLATGALKRLVDHSHVVGITSNPTIFANAISGSADYDDQIRELAQRGTSTAEALRLLTVADVQNACDVLRPVYNATDSIDGRVSIEVDPRLADDTAGAIIEARQLWRFVDRPNLFIKIPATKAGLPAITQCLAEGLSVNVTLIFSLRRYAEVIDAFLDGIEQAHTAGRNLSTLASVASFFVSRVDTEIDNRLDKIGTPEALALKGTAAIANARLAYEHYERVFSGDRWQALLAGGARPQRPLWASTGVKDPSYDDTRYVVNLCHPCGQHHAAGHLGGGSRSRLHPGRHHPAVLPRCASGVPRHRRCRSRLRQRGRPARERGPDEVRKILGHGHRRAQRPPPHHLPASQCRDAPLPRERARSMTTVPSFIIVGGGLAGAIAAQTLREEGFDGRITLLGDEPHRPYERPPLSKDYLQGNADRESIFVHPEPWYVEHEVELCPGATVTTLDPGSRTVTTATGARLGYHKLLLATGSTPRRLSLQGSDLDGVHYLRSVDDSDRIKASFARARRVAIIGAGWIGLETTAAARHAGLDVTLLEHAELPLLRVLGPEAAPIFADLHRDHGVDLRCEVAVAELTGRNGSVTGLMLSDGSRIEADMVLVGIGITPNTELAAAAGLQVGNGITVDDHLRTSDPDIYAAGDVANAYNPRLGRHLRVEHWANARRQGATAAKAMLGHDAVDARPSYFYSDQYDLGMEYTGDIGPSGYDQVVLRRHADSSQVIVFWLQEQCVLAGMNINIWDVAGDIEQLVQSSRPVDPDDLADPDMPLATLLQRRPARQTGL